MSINTNFYNSLYELLNDNSSSLLWFPKTIYKIIYIFIDMFRIMQLYKRIL